MLFPVYNSPGRNMCLVQHYVLHVTYIVIFRKLKNKINQLPGRAQPLICAAPIAKHNKSTNWDAFDRITFKFLDSEAQASCKRIHVGTFSRLPWIHEQRKLVSSISRVKYFPWQKRVPFKHRLHLKFFLP